MSDSTYSVAERALCVLTNRLQMVRSADGYRTDGGLHVYRSRRNVPLASLPAIVIWDTGEQVQRGGDGDKTMDIDMSVTVEALVKAEQDDTGFSLECLKADIKRALMGTPERYALTDEDGQIGSLGYIGASTFPREDGGSSEAITMRFHVLYTERSGDPYSNN